MKPKTDNTSMGNPPTGTYFEKPKPQTIGIMECTGFGIAVY